MPKYKKDYGMTFLREFGDFLLHEKKWWVPATLLFLALIVTFIIYTDRSCLDYWSVPCENISLRRIER